MYRQNKPGLNQEVTTSNQEIPVNPEALNQPEQTPPPPPPKSSKNAWIFMTIFSILLTVVLIGGAFIIYRQYTSGNLPKAFYTREPKNEPLINLNQQEEELLTLVVSLKVHDNLPDGSHEEILEAKSKLFNELEGHNFTDITGEEFKMSKIMTLKADREAFKIILNSDLVSTASELDKLSRPL